MGSFFFRPRRNLANTASLLWHAYKSLPAPSKDVNWAGMFNADLPAPLPTTLGASMCPA